MGVIIRLLVLIALVWLIVTALRRPTRPSSTDNLAGAGPLLACAHCHLNVPEKEGCHAEGRFFCCLNHRDAWLRNHAS